MVCFARAFFPALLALLCQAAPPAGTDAPWPVDKCEGWSEGKFRCPLTSEASEEQRAGMLRRSEWAIHTAVQQLRFLTDSRVRRKALGELWWELKDNHDADWSWIEIHSDNLLGLHIRDILFLEGVLEHSQLEAARDYMEQPVEHQSTQAVTSPDGKTGSTAASHAIAVEVWDDCFLSNKFLGEAGVPALPGAHSHTLQLQKNKWRSKEDITGQGSVTVDTEISFTPKDCSDDWGGQDWLSHGKCFTIDLKVTCRSAQGLPDTGVLGTTDPYCKVRVKKDFTHPSTKDSTPTSKNTVNPSWSEGNVFTYSWEAPALSEESEQPLLLDKLSLVQQLQGFLAQLVRQAMLPARSQHGWCVAHLSEGSNKWAWDCELLEFIESSHDTPVNRTYTGCQHREATDDGECKMRLMKKLAKQAAQGKSPLKRDIRQLSDRQWSRFQDDRVVPGGHTFVAALLLGMAVEPRVGW